jgi:hypothetical protein
LLAVSFFTCDGFDLNDSLFGITAGLIFPTFFGKNDYSYQKNYFTCKNSDLIPKTTKPSNTCFEKGTFLYLRENSQRFTLLAEN